MPLIDQRLNHLPQTTSAFESTHPAIKNNFLAVEETGGIGWIISPILYGIFRYFDIQTLLKLIVNIPFAPMSNSFLYRSSHSKSTVYFISYFVM